MKHKRSLRFGIVPKHWADQKQMYTSDRLKDLLTDLGEFTQSILTDFISHKSGTLEPLDMGSKFSQSINSDPTLSRYWMEAPL